VNKGIQVVGKGIANAYSAVSDFVGRAGRAIGSAATTAFNATKDFVGRAGQAIGNAATTAYNATRDFIVRAGVAIGDAASTAWEWTKGLATDVAQKTVAIANTVGEEAAKIYAAGKRIAQDAGKMIEDGWNAVTGAVSDVYDWISGSGNARRNASMEPLRKLLNDPNARISDGYRKELEAILEQYDSNYKEALPDIVSRVGKGAVQGITTAMHTVAKIFDDAIAACGTVPPKVMSAIQSIISGYIEPAWQYLFGGYIDVSNSHPYEETKKIRNKYEER
jgi:hypothetical protein